MLPLYPILTKHTLKLTVAYVLLYSAAIAFTIGFHHDFWTDEGHFYRTIQLFISSPSIHTLTHYGEMSTPLPFILYAIWGKIFGIEIASLRLFSLLIAFSTFLSLYFVVVLIFPSEKILGLLSVTAFSIIPYVPGLSFFVYTDLPAIFFMLLAWICLIINKPLMLFLFSSASLWSRQYQVFFLAACMTFVLLQILNASDRKKNIKLGISLVLSAASLLPLVALWGGLSPDNDIKNQYLIESTRYSFTALNTYLYTIALFSLPFLIPILPYLLKDFKLTIISFATSFLYLLYPIQSSEASIQLGYYHVGFFHKLVSKIFIYPWQSGILFQILIFFSLLFLFSYFRKMLRELQTFQGFEILTICFFLIVMPFSYLTWEKYAIPVIPFVYIAIFKSPEFAKFLEFLKTIFIKND